VEAVGRTNTVTGTMTIVGTRVATVSVTADLQALRSDETRRDNKLRTSGLETEKFPTATFALRSPIDLPGTSPANVETTATGTLTLHGVTKPVTVSLEATRSGDRIVVVGSAPIVLSDYGIDPPNIGGFVSVDNRGTMEFKVYFVPKA
ncbi:MAG: YceI family protein, partial [Acidimicrobiia bacterium]